MCIRDSLDFFVSDEASKPETLSRIAQMTAALTRLIPVCNDRSISLSSKIRLMCSLVTSIFLYACESWTLTAQLEREIRAMEIRCYCKISRISYKDCYQLGNPCQDPEDNGTTWRPDHRKETQIAVVWTCLPSSGLAQTILQGAVKGGRRKRRQKKMWEGNIREWTGLEFAKSQRAVEKREK